MAAELPCRLHVVLPIVENAIGPDAFRPGDILPSRAGQTVEIVNTDAEGRLILGDALFRAAESGPELIIDFATLTGAARVAVGPELAAYFTVDDALASALEKGAAAVSDPVWRLPLWPGYNAKLSSQIADVKHAANDPFAGSSVAALFLQRFVGECAWMHFDTYAWNQSTRPGRAGGRRCARRAGGLCNAARAFRVSLGRAERQDVLSAHRFRCAGEGNGDMAFNRRRLLAAGGGLVLGGCTGASGDLPGLRRRPGFARGAPLKPLKISEDRLMRITVCTRPFRAAGPRLEAESVDGRRVVHNYGHGGAGWSLAWGCADDAAALALGSGADSFAVIGAGAMGLTTALRLVESGVDVTVYARDFPAETRSARATGVWSPSSRIGLEDVVEPGFEERWERWARTSFAVHQHYIGLPGDPVEFADQYTLRDEDVWPPRATRRPYLHLDRNLRDIVPSHVNISPREHPFPVAWARRGQRMVFNVAAYSDRLLQDFLLRGGRIVRTEFSDMAAVLDLDEPVIVNCMGFGARSVCGDDALQPVRGQINWLTPQPEARYGLFYNDVSAVSRRDGLVVQYIGSSDDYGLGEADETPDRAEMSNALARLAPLFA